MLVVRQLIYGITPEVLALAFQEPVIVGLVDILQILSRQRQLVRLAPRGSTTATGLLSNDKGDTIKLSAKTGAGLNLLKQVLLNIIGKTPNDEGLFLARTRHLEALQNALSELDNALIYIQQNDLLAEHLRHTQNHLGKITGEFSPDELLGEIFSRFCIGK